MKAEELAVIKERAEKATDGPWEYRKFDEDSIDVASVAANEYGERKLVVDIHIGEQTDAHFIAHARQDVPKLVAEVERLQAEKASLLNALQSINALCEATENIRQNRELLLIDEIAFDVLNEVDDE